MIPDKGGFNINLESLIDLSTKLNQTFDDGFIINSALLSLMGKLRILRACFLVPCRKIDIPAGSGYSRPPGSDCYFNIRLVKGKIPDMKIPFFMPVSFRELSMRDSGEKTLFDAGFRYVVPIVYQNCLKGVICLGPGYDNKSVTDEEKLYVHLVATITAGALNGSESERSIIEAKNNAERRSQLLMSLFEISSEFNTILSRRQIIRNLSYRLMGQLMVNRCAIYLQDNEKEYVQADSRLDGDIRPGILNGLAALDKATALSELPLDSDCQQELEKAGVRIVSPMKHQGATKGFLAIGRKMNEEPFSEENYQFIDALGNIAISALENERLFLEEIEKKRLEDEMHLAMNIQKNLLPREIVPVQGYDISGINIPSFKVGGDYYDIVPLPGGSVMLAIADVSGKGAPAALLMANVQAALRVLAPMGLPLAELMLKLNHLVYTNTGPDRFITLFLGILDPAGHTFTYINGGHNPPLHHDGSRFGRLAEGGIILGVMPAPRPYELGSIRLGPGHSVVFYTDGITEAMNSAGEEYSEERLKKAIAACRGCTAKLMLESIIAGVREYSGGESQSDDITMIALVRAE